MASNTDICNMALGHIGVSKPIANLESEQSVEAQALRLYYDMAFKETLRARSWSFAKVIASLSLVATSPTKEWRNAYRYPSDCVFFRKIQSGIRNDTRQSRAPYVFSSDDQGKLIYTDVDLAIGEYSVVRDESRWDADFVLAMSYKLAELVAPMLAKGDPFKLGQQSGSKFIIELEKASAMAMNEEQAEEDPESEYIRARY